jgi:hypothetical protein
MVVLLDVDMIVCFFTYFTYRDRLKPKPFGFLKQPADRFVSIDPGLGLKAQDKHS